MKMIFPILLGTVLVLSSSSCGSDGTTDPVGDPPTVVAATPSVAGGTVGLLQDFTLTFSDPMNPATLNASTVTVTPMSGGLHLEYDADTRTLWVAPDSLFPPGATLTLSVSGGASDMGGNSLEPFSQNFSTGPFECANLGDRFEPNDVALEAVAWETDTRLVGLSTCVGDKDYFRFSVTDTVKLTAFTDVSHADSVSWAMNWMRENGDYYATLGTRATPGRINEYSYSFLPGTYWLEIYGHHEEELVLYDLTVEAGPPCRDDPFEDNDFRDQATAIDPGVIPDLIGCDVDIDWFTLPILNGQTITVTMELPPGYNGIRRLFVQEPGLASGRESGLGGTVTVSVVATQDGMVFFYTRLWEDDVPYQLTVEVTGP